MEDHYCKRCKQLMSLRFGDEPTPYCDHCAHERVVELEQLVARLRRQISNLKLQKGRHATR